MFLEIFVKKCDKLFDKRIKIIYNSIQLANANKENGEKRFMDLTIAEIGKEYLVERIETQDDELNTFLFSLGCYSGEPITLVSRRGGSFIVAIKDARYSVDKDLARAIVVRS